MDFGQVGEKTKSKTVREITLTLKPFRSYFHIEILTNTFATELSDWSPILNVFDDNAVIDARIKRTKHKKNS